ncbi:serine hydrolase domain-containing protein [Frankia sp. AgKG'84/4]|uniref:serine hydrolase domain-containing protein n=1 Tax=Frankia sp. AgKG'84/4 TaxID=573490 RepID=UPI00200E8B6C|nr:serine hydrolase domain-containing protein [Frankia sp. AgKG'84/4]MCL9794191.1 beta-lactamase family protein [Frankia sp. AgKG'84/4]
MPSGSPSAPEAARADPSADGQDLLPGTRRLLLRLLAAEQVAGRAPSIVASVARDGQPVWTGGRGRAVALGGMGTDGTGRPGPDTQYRIGSITKTFTAVLVMRLRDEGRLALGDPLDEYLPGTPVGDRTIAQLLAHLGGIAAETPPPWWERVEGATHPVLADALGPAPQRFRPGRRHHYSNVGFAVLGELVARLRAMTWAEALHRELLEPLGMRRTTAMPTAPHAQGFAVHPHADVLLPEPAYDSGVMAPAGQLWSTGTDLVRWAAVLGGHTDAVLSPDTLAEMREPAAVEGDTGEWRLGAGLGVQLLRVPDGVLVGHGGSMPGFVAALWTRSVGTAAVALANATSGVAVGDLAVSLIDAVDTAEPPLPAEWVPAGPAGRESLDLTGVWYWGAAAYSVTLRVDGSLLLVPVGGHGRASLLRADPGGDTWTGVDGYFAGETLTPCRRDGGVSHLELASFVFTRGPYSPAGPVPGGVDGDGWRSGPGAAVVR